jgi:PAS domain S-box-containing protein
LFVALKREGRIVGTLSLDDPGQIRTFSSQQQQLARAIGQQAALAIDNARLYHESQTERQRAERLIQRAQATYEVALAANSGQDLHAVLQIATEHLIRILHANSAAIALLEADTLYLISHTLPQELDGSTTPLRLVDMLGCQQAIATGKPFLVKVQEAQKSEAIWYRQLGGEHILIVPLIVGAHQTVGFLFVIYHDAYASPGKGEYAFAQDIAAQCASAIEKARLLANVRETAALATERANTLNGVFQAMTEGITVINQQGQVVARNQAAAQFLGDPIRDIDDLGAFLQRQPAYTLHGQQIAPEDFPLARALRGEYIRGERFITTRRDGAERVIEMNVTHMLDDNKQDIGLVTAFHDVTEQTLIEQRIRQALTTMLHVAEAVSGVTDIQDILRNVLSRTLTTLNCARGLVQLYDEEQHLFQPAISIGFNEERAAQWVQEHYLWLSPSAEQDHRYQARRSAASPAPPSHTGSSHHARWSRAWAADA